MVQCNSDGHEQVSETEATLDDEGDVLLCSGGHYLNFDLSWPSSSIPSTFFPSDPSLYGMSLVSSVSPSSY